MCGTKMTQSSTEGEEDPDDVDSTQFDTIKRKERRKSNSVINNTSKSNSCDKVKNGVDSRKHQWHSAI